MLNLSSSRLAGVLGVLVCVVSATVLACSSTQDHPPTPGPVDSAVADFGPRDTALPDTTRDDAKDAVAVDGDAAPTCTDLLRNGDEADTDCGGLRCPACGEGKMCTDPIHCASLVCTGGKCIAATCTDLVKNGTETDNDCGGSCPACLIGKGCIATADCVSGVCTDKQCKCPIGMTIMPTAVLAGGNYCIDTTETTYESYVKFWTANPPLSTSQPAYCTAWNTSWTPTGAWPPDPTTENTFPVRYVDWCDAFAYCKWAGKALCGKLGGGSVALGEAANHLKSQWYNACSAQGANVYPYSGPYSPTKCNGAEWAGTADAGASRPQSTAISGPVTGATAGSCQGGAPGLYGMSGNVAEWEDSCSGATGESDTCLARGGSFRSPGPAMSCDKLDRQVARNTTDDDIGFRCCAQY